MAFSNPKGRANYEPNSWSGEERGPREDPVAGYRTAVVRESGETRRVRPESFADHYSQARQFYASQTPVEQGHIVSAFVFELSKVETEAIRLRMVANLRNVDEGLAEGVAEGLGQPLPDRATPAAEPIDLPESPALSILLNGPNSFAGRTLGILVSDGADAKTLSLLREAVEAEGGQVELVAAQVGGVTTSDKSHHSADHQVDGGPSVLFDAVAIVTSESGASILAGHAPARDWVTDAHAHCKFVAYTTGARPLLEAAGVTEEIDDGYVELDRRKTTAARFLKMCRGLRHWAREPEVAAL